MTKFSLVGTGFDYECANGTSLQGYVRASYLDLAARFGECTGAPSPDGKISTEFIFRSEDGRVATVYDYKTAGTYRTSSRWQERVAEFRSLPSYEWHVGAKDKETADEFIEWLRKELE